MAAPPLPITLTPYERRYRQAVRDLMFRNYQTHTHLDWYETDHWLNVERTPIRLAWQRGRLVGLLAASHPLDGASWIRLAAIHDQATAEPLLAQMWENLAAELRARGVAMVAFLALRDWVEDKLPLLGFRYREDVVTLARSSRQLPDPPVNEVYLRPYVPADLETIARVDQDAFAPPWQLSLDEIRQATRMSAVCTVALLNQAVVGYQLSTFFYEGGHLARLAVLPDRQGSGVGNTLLSDLIYRFARRNIYGITVNTQSTNHRSQRLYARFDFHPNGYNLPVWTISI